MQTVRKPERVPGFRHRGRGDRRQVLASARLRPRSQRIRTPLDHVPAVVDQQRA